MADKLVTIAEFPSYIEAEMAKQLLAENGIEAIASGENTANTYAGLPALGQVELQTLEDMAEKARQILESHNQQDD